MMAFLMRSAVLLHILVASLAAARPRHASPSQPHPSIYDSHPKALAPLVPYHQQSPSPRYSSHHPNTTNTESATFGTHRDSSDHAQTAHIGKRVMIEGERMMSQQEISEMQTRLAKRDGEWQEEERNLMRWVKQMEYTGKSFFDGWEFFHGPDPSHGLINYTDSDTAIQKGLAFWTDQGVAGIQVDHWNHLPVGTPRNSVRISTTALYAGGLFIIDMPLMPWGCGVWPAFWTLGYGAPWPSVGEIDIVEGVQAMTNNQYTVHTNPGCSINQKPGLYSGTITNPVCDHESGGTGCGIVSSSATSFGEPFNAAGGGVFAMQWDGAGLKFWNWNRNQIPEDIHQQDPQPQTWGTPAAAIDASSCDPYAYFQAQALILNVNLCGDWAGNNYNQYSYCPGTCETQVADPANLANAVMLVNSLRIYQQSGIPAVVGQAESGFTNQTGAGGAVRYSDSIEKLRKVWWGIVGAGLVGTVYSFA